jgi:hypothetical protein
MWRSPYAAGILFLLFFATVRAADPPPDLPKKPLGTDVSDIEAFLKIAIDTNKALPVRVGAVLELGNLAPPKDTAAQLYFKDVFKYLLKNPAAAEYERNYYLFHVVRSVGNVGSFMVELKAWVVSLKANDKILDSEIDASLKKMTPPVPPPAAQAASGHADNIKKWLAQVADTTAAVADRLTASDSLAKLLSAGDKGDITAILDLKTGLPAAITNADLSTRIIAAKLAKPAIDAATKTLDSGVSKSVKDAYVAGLGKMLVPTSVPEFVEAAQAIGAIGPPDAATDPIQTALKKVATADPKDFNPAVILEAQVALTSINPTKP